MVELVAKARLFFIYSFGVSKASLLVVEMEGFASDKSGRRSPLLVSEI